MKLVGLCVMVTIIMNKFLISLKCKGQLSQIVRLKKTNVGPSQCFPLLVSKEAMSKNFTGARAMSGMNRV